MNLFQFCDISWRQPKQSMCPSKNLRCHRRTEPMQSTAFWRGSQSLSLLYFYLNLILIFLSTCISKRSKHSVREWWTTPSKLGKSCCPKPRSISVIPKWIPVDLLSGMITYNNHHKGKIGVFEASVTWEV